MKLQKKVSVACSLIGSLLMAGALGAAEASFNPLNQRL